MARAPVFLERKSYRRRRMMDAVRILPALGLALWMIPLMWSFSPDMPQEQGMPMSAALRYIFGVWVFMVLAGWALWRRTRRPSPDPDTPS